MERLNAYTIAQLNKLAAMEAELPNTPELQRAFSLIRNYMHGRDKHAELRTCTNRIFMSGFKREAVR